MKYAKNFNTWRDVSAYLGEHEATVSIWRKRNSPSALEKILYRAKGDVSDTWLLTGEGPMLEADARPGEKKVKKERQSAVASTMARQMAHGIGSTNVSPAPHDSRSAIKVPVISWVQAGEIAASKNAVSGFGGVFL